MSEQQRFIGFGPGIDWIWWIIIIIIIICLFIPGLFGGGGCGCKE